jgi:hypothetical protein
MPDPARAEPSERKLYRPDPSDEVELRAAVADIAAGRGVTLTEAELLEWEATPDGELPESVQSRVLDVLACPAPSR